MMFNASFPRRIKFVKRFFVHTYYIWRVVTVLNWVGKLKHLVNCFFLYRFDYRRRCCSCEIWNFHCVYKNIVCSIYRGLPYIYTRKAKKSFLAIKKTPRHHDGALLKRYFIFTNETIVIYSYLLYRLFQIWSHNPP